MNEQNKSVGKKPFPVSLSDAAGAGHPFRGRISEQTVSETFENGLRVFIYPRHEAKSVNIQAVVETGSMHEENYLGCGLSHFLEHMVFSGTTRFPGQTEIADTVNRFGGVLNACTSYEYTMYYMNVPSEHLLCAADMLYGMIAEPLFPEDRFRKEKEIIIRECSMRDDRPESVLFERLCQQVFRRHPMRCPIIGYRDRIEAVDRSMMMDYFERRYAPGRTFFVVSGDVDPERFLDHLRSAASTWRRGRIDDPAIPAEPLQNEARFDKSYFNDPLARFSIGWRIPENSHPDLPALDVLASILGGSESSRLFRKLRTEEELVLNIDAFNYGNTLTGTGIITALLKSGNVDSAIERTFGLLNEMRQGGIDAAELGRAVAEQEMTLLRSMKSNTGIGRLIAGSVMATGSTDSVDNYLEQLGTISCDQVVDALNRYYSESAFSVCRQLPESERGVRTKKTCSAPGRKEPLFRTFSGAQRAVFIEDRSLPLIDISLILPGGSAFENRQNSGISSLLAECLLTGTADYTESEFNEALDNHAIQLSAAGGGTAFQIRFQCMKSKLEYGLPLLRSMLSSALFPEKQFLREKHNLIDELESEATEPRIRGKNELLAALFPGHPYGVTIQDSIESLEALDLATLRDYWKTTVLNAPSACFAISGDLSGEEAFALLESLIDAVDWNHNPVSAPPPVSVDGGCDFREITMEKEQAVVFYGMPAPGLESPDRMAMELLQNLLGGGMSARLFKSVREEEGLAYYTSMMYLPFAGTGAIGMFAGTRSDAAERVFELFEQERCKLLSGGIGDAEFQAAKASLLFQTEEQAQDTALTALSSALAEFCSLGYRSPFTRAERLRAFPLELLNDAAKRLFANAKRVGILVSPEKARKKPDFNQNAH